MKFRYLTAGLCGLSLILAATANAAEVEMSREAELLCPVFVGRPAERSVTLSVVNGETPFTGKLCTQEEGADSWTCRPLELGATSQENLKGGTKLVQIDGLKEATRYHFEVRDQEDRPLFNGQGTFVTQRSGSAPFRFVAMTDAHVNPLNPERNIVLRTCADVADRLNPDFVFHMGDNIQTVASSHGGPATQEEHPSIFYLYWRQVLGNYRVTLQILS